MDSSVDEVRYAFKAAYWLILLDFRRNLTYSDVRRFKLPYVAGSAAICAMIRRYLSNSHVDSDGRFSLKMIAALVLTHNCTVDRLRMGTLDGQLTDYRSV
ncbi:hypothetical protein AAVH_23839 [Aphelenchoides avenae]|nr:hypothetical protein AAVH_23838 [Aphelenchus avenae]KAH7708901.1 hypothetical protein AAVH_23839 [Aphelenchus avenae]